MTTTSLMERDDIAREMFATIAEGNGYPLCACAIRKRDDPFYERVTLRAMKDFAAISFQPRVSKEDAIAAMVAELSRQERESDHIPHVGELYEDAEITIDGMIDLGALAEAILALIGVK